MPNCGPYNDYYGLHVTLEFLHSSALSAICILNLMQREVDLPNLFLSAVGCVSFTHKKVAEGTHWSGRWCPSQGLFMCRATYAAHWSPVIDEVALRSVTVQGAEWGENGGKEDSLLSDLQLWDFCNQGSQFIRERKIGNKGEREARKSHQKGEEWENIGKNLILRTNS